MKFYIVCRANKNGNKYLSLFKRDADSDKFISSDFNTLKRVLGVSVYANIQNLVKDWDIGQEKDLSEE